LTEEQILSWRARLSRRARPQSSASSGEIPGTGETWNKIDQALRKGSAASRAARPCRSCCAATSLRTSLLPPSGLSAKQILRWADQHFARTGAWPRWDSGRLPMRQANCGGGLTAP